MPDASEIFLHETVTGKDGKELTIPAPSFGTRAAFVQWLEKSAIDFVRRHKTDLGDDFAAALAVVTRKGAAKQFGWRSEAWYEALNTDEGAFELAYLAMKQEAADLERPALKELWEALGGVFIDPKTNEQVPPDQATKGAEIMQKLWGIMNRPNSPRPSSATGESGPT